MTIMNELITMTRMQFFITVWAVGFVLYMIGFKIGRG